MKLQSLPRAEKTMKFEPLANSVEANIKRLFKKFIEKPAVFLSKSDVMCYLYYLLVTDPFLGYSPTIKNLAPSIAQSKTFLVHAGLNVSIDGKNEQVTLSIGESKKETELSAWDFLIGIEIEHNMKAYSEMATVLSEGIRKLLPYKKAYLLWLTWDTPFDDKSRTYAEKTVAQHENLRFYFVECSSMPIRTNLKNIL